MKTKSLLAITLMVFIGTTSAMAMTEVEATTSNDVTAETNKVKRVKAPRLVKAAIRNNINTKLDAYLKRNSVQKPDEWTDWGKTEKKDYLEQQGLDVEKLEVFKEKVVRKANHAIKLAKIVQVGKIIDENNIPDKYKAAITFARNNGIMKGDELADGTRAINAEKEVKRIDFFIMFKRIMNRAGAQMSVNEVAAKFKDFDKTQWYGEEATDAVAWKVFQGDGNGLLRLTDSVTQPEAVAMAVRIMGIETAGYTHSAVEAGNWYSENMSYVLETGVLDEADYNLTHELTRGETAELIQNFVNQQQDINDGFVDYEEYEEGMEEEDDMEEEEEGEEDDMEEDENDNVSTLCENEGGTYYQDYNECENISENTCEALDGTYEPCASACRHDGEAEICVTVCVEVCSL